MTNKNIRYFELAKEVSKLSDFHSHHIGCIITYGHHIISTAYNTNKSSPLQAKYNKYCGLDENNINHKMHGEIYALSKIKDLDNIDCNKIDIYIWREHKDGIRALSRPCNACMSMIKDNGIKNIYYTGEDSYIYEKLA
jgi:deoxycytidylate deaminase